MDKKNKLLLGSFAALFLVAGSLSFVNNDKTNYVKTEATTVSRANIASYYSSIDDDLEGTALKDALHELNESKKTSNVGYGDFRFFAEKCDADPDGSGKILGFYDNKLVGPDWDGGSTWNREHVWPKSRKGSLVENDAHMVRPASTKTNSDRGNGFFAETGAYDPGKYVEEYRGITARIIFYCAIADTNLSLSNKYNDDTKNGTMGRLEDLLKWNIQYSSTDPALASRKAMKCEQNRNNVIQNDKDGQGNRNPFIDHPEYACKIWGNTNEATRQICSMSTQKYATSIEIVNPKTEYISGDDFEKPTVIATYSDESTREVTNECTFSGYNLKNVGQQVVTVNFKEDYSDLTETYSITVKEKPVTIASLELSNIVSEYHQFDEFIKPKVKAYYSNGTLKVVTNEATFTGYDMSMVGEQEVTVSYEGLEKNYKINVLEAAIPTEPSEPTTPSDPTNVTDPTMPYEPSEITIPSEPIIPSEPVVPTTPSEPEKKTAGCGGSIAASSLLISIASSGALALLFSRKRKQK